MTRKEAIKEYSEAVLSGNSTKALTITPQIMPAKLFHYASFSEFWHSKIIQGQLYLSDPVSFNDPYDCRIQGNTDYWIRQYLKEHPTPDAKNFIHELLSGDIQIHYKGKYMSIDEYNELACNEFKSRFRVACLSEANDSMLMWSHYAAMHSGYAIELDTSKIYATPYDRIHLRKVVYDKKAITIDNLVRSVSKEAFLLCKSPAWKYEKEWRYFDVNKYFWNISSYISAIYLGSRFDVIKHFHEVNAIQKHCRDNKIKLFRMQIDDFTYKLYPVEITNSSLLYEGR